MCGEQGCVDCSKEKVNAPFNQEIQTHSGVTVNTF